MTPLGPCRYPGCPNLQARDGGGYCEEHRREGEILRGRGRGRGSARARGYDRRYEKARAWVLQRQPLCAVCLEEGRVTEATMTHHVIPLAEGGTSDPDNLLPVCEDCHERLHRGEHRVFPGERLWGPAAGLRVSDRSFQDRG